jgi:hypothetical protein
MLKNVNKIDSFIIRLVIFNYNIRKEKQTIKSIKFKKKSSRVTIRLVEKKENFRLLKKSYPPTRQEKCSIFR